MLADRLIISDPKTHVKRVASSGLEEELARAKRQQKDWERLENLIYQVRRMSETYNADWGTDLPPLIPKVDPLLDGPVEDAMTGAGSSPPEIITLATTEEVEAMSGKLCQRTERSIRSIVLLGLFCFYCSV